MLDTPADRVSCTVSLHSAIVKSVSPIKMKTALTFFFGNLSRCKEENSFNLVGFLNFVRAGSPTASIDLDGITIMDIGGTGGRFSPDEAGFTFTASDA